MQAMSGDHNSGDTGRYFNEGVSVPYPDDSDIKGCKSPHNGEPLGLDLSGGMVGTLHSPKEEVGVYDQEQLLHEVRSQLMPDESAIASPSDHSSVSSPGLLSPNGRGIGGYHTPDGLVVDANTQLSLIESSARLHLEDSISAVDDSTILWPANGRTGEDGGEMVEGGQFNERIRKVRKSLRESDTSARNGFLEAEDDEHCFDMRGASSTSQFLFTKFGIDVPGVTSFAGNSQSTPVDALESARLTSNATEPAVRSLTSKPRASQGKTGRRKEPSLVTNYPSKLDGYELQIVSQPEEQHRARYKTEGSRGAIKDSSGQGHPVVQLLGFNEPARLQAFIGNDSGRVRPHGFYQACRVSGKNSTPCTERDVDGTTVIEIMLHPSSDMKAVVDCVGILKLRNADVEQGGSNVRSKKKSTKARIVFRVSLPKPDGSTETLQVSSQPILCTQPTGLPEISKKSLSECSAEGGEEMFIIGKNFMKVTSVRMEEKQGDDIVWSADAEINNDYFQQSHLICTVPPYRDVDIQEPVDVNIIVQSQGRISEPSPFSYTPLSKPNREEHHLPMETDQTLHTIAPAASFQEAVPTDTKVNVSEVLSREEPIDVKPELDQDEMPPAKLQCMDMHGGSSKQSTGMGGFAHSDDGYATPNTSMSSAEPINKEVMNLIQQKESLHKDQIEEIVKYLSSTSNKDHEPLSGEQHGSFLQQHLEMPQSVPIKSSEHEQSAGIGHPQESTAFAQPIQHSDLYQMESSVPRKETAMDTSTGNTTKEPSEFMSHQTNSAAAPFLVTDFLQTQSQNNFDQQEQIRSDEYRNQQPASGLTVSSSNSAFPPNEIPSSAPEPSFPLENDKFFQMLIKEGISGEMGGMAANSNSNAQRPPDTMGNNVDNIPHPEQSHSHSIPTSSTSTSSSTPAASINENLLKHVGQQVLQQITNSVVQHLGKTGQTPTESQILHSISQLTQTPPVKQEESKPAVDQSLSAQFSSDVQHTSSQPCSASEQSLDVPTSPHVVLSPHSNPLPTSPSVISPAMPTQQAPNMPPPQTSNMPPLQASNIPPQQASNLPPSQSSNIHLEQSTNISMVQSSNISLAQSSNMAQVQSSSMPLEQASSNMPMAQSSNMPLEQSSSNLTLAQSNMPLEQSSNMAQTSNISLVQSNNIPQASSSMPQAQSSNITLATSNVPLAVAPTIRLAAPNVAYSPNMSIAQPTGINLTSQPNIALPTQVVSSSAAQLPQTSFSQQTPTISGSPLLVPGQLASLIQSGTAKLVMTANGTYSLLLTNPSAVTTLVPDAPQLGQFILGQQPAMVSSQTVPTQSTGTHPACSLAPTLSQTSALPQESSTPTFSSLPHNFSQDENLGVLSQMTEPVHEEMDHSGMKPTKKQDTLLYRILTDSDQTAMCGNSQNTSQSSSQQQASEPPLPQLSPDEVTQLLSGDNLPPSNPS